MVMEVDRHETILNRLNDPELTHNERTELLTELRADFTGVVTDLSEQTKTIKDLEKEKTDLVQAHSQLFRERGAINSKENLKDIVTQPVNIKDLFK